MKVQAPPEVSEQVPSAWLPSEKATVPVGIPSPEVTVIVKVMLVPYGAGFWELARLVVVAARLFIKRIENEAAEMAGLQRLDGLDDRRFFVLVVQRVVNNLLFD